MQHFIKTQYIIQYTHVLTFSTEYRKVIAPFFSLPDLKYGLNNQGTFEEHIRLVFEKGGYVIVCQKDGIALIYEGDISELKRSTSGPLSTFFDILAAIKSMLGFGKVLLHQVHTHTLLHREGPIAELKAIEGSKVLKSVPFREVKDFAVTFETKAEEVEIFATVGNYRENDIVKFDLTPFKTDYNLDVLKKYSGYLCDLKVKETEELPTYGKFKKLLDTSFQKIDTLDAWI